MKEQWTDRDFLQSVIARMPGHVYLKDLKGRYIGCNDQQAKTLNLPSFKSLIGKTDFELYPPYEAEKLYKTDCAVMSSGIPQSLEETSTMPNGEKRTFLSKKEPLKDLNGNIIGILGISFDITEEKIKKQTLESEQYAITKMALDNVISNMPGHVYWKDLNFKYLGCNPLQAHSFGKESSEEVIGKDDF